MSVADLKKYRALAAELSKKMFNKFNFTKYFQEKNPEMLVFVPFSQGLEKMEEGAIYDKLTGLASCQKLLNGALDQYNENNASMDLVLLGREKRAPVTVWAGRRLHVWLTPVTNYGHRAPRSRGHHVPSLCD